MATPAAASASPSNGRVSIARPAAAPKPAAQRARPLVLKRAAQARPAAAQNVDVVWEKYVADAERFIPDPAKASAPAIDAGRPKPDARPATYRSAVLAPSSRHGRTQGNRANGASSSAWPGKDVDI